MKKIILTLALTYSLLHSEGFQSTNYGAGGAEFLKLPVHAHSASLCGAVAAWSGEIAGVQYNPALLDGAVDCAFGFIGSYTFKSLGQKHFGMTAAGSFGRFIIAGLSFVNHGVTDIEGRDSLGAFTEYFNFSENAVTATVAGRLHQPISLGCNIRYLFESLEKENAHGIGLDVGTTIYPLKYFRFGISVLNIASYLWWSTGHTDRVLTTARLGVGGIFIDSTLVVEIDGVKSLQQPIDLLFGIEYNLLKIITVRLGLRTSVDIYDSEAKTPDFAFGLGMQKIFYGFEYTFYRPTSELGISHKFSIRVVVPKKARVY